MPHCFLCQDPDKNVHNKRKMLLLFGNFINSDPVFNSIVNVAKLLYILCVALNRNPFSSNKSKYVEVSQI